MGNALNRSTVVVTGATTGIGLATKAILQANGSTVISVDLKSADIIADLSKASDCSAVITQLEDQCPDGIDGLVTCAGVGPHTTPKDLIATVNFYGCIDLIKGLRSSLAKKKGRVVAVSSNAALLPNTNDTVTAAFINEDRQTLLSLIEPHNGSAIYGASKKALIQWIRKNAADFIAEGINLNVVAPGITKTPLTDEAFNDEAYGSAMKQFLEMTPYGNIATPEMIAKPIAFLLSEAAEFMVGSLLVVDGGVDANLRNNA